jgi:hypothetical protein
MSKGANPALKDRWHVTPRDEAERDPDTTPERKKAILNALLGTKKRKTIKAPRVAISIKN